MRTGARRRAPDSSNRSSESAVVNERTIPRTAGAVPMMRPTEYASSSLSLKRGAKPASRASADAAVQEHRFEGGGPFGLPGGRLPTPPNPAVAPGAPLASHAAGATRRSSSLLSDTSTGSNTTSGLPRRSPSLSPSSAATFDTATRRAPAPASGSGRSRSGST